MTQKNLLFELKTEIDLVVLKTLPELEEKTSGLLRSYITCFNKPRTKNEK